MHVRMRNPNQTNKIIDPSFFTIVLSLRACVRARVQARVRACVRACVCVCSDFSLSLYFFSFLAYPFALFITLVRLCIVSFLLSFCSMEYHRFSSEILPAENPVLQKLTFPIKKCGVCKTERICFSAMPRVVSYPQFRLLCICA